MEAPMGALGRFFGFGLWAATGGENARHSFRRDEEDEDDLPPADLLCYRCGECGGIAVTNIPYPECEGTLDDEHDPEEMEELENEDLDPTIGLIVNGVPQE
jgi:hypothetical protein